MSSETKTRIENAGMEVYSFTYGDVPINFAILDEFEHIQAQILKTQGFYEAELLKALTVLVPRNGVVVDAGANLGNHTVFFAAVMGCTVYSFEPFPRNFDHLMQNIELNGLNDLVIASQLGLSDETRNDLIMTVADEQNLGIAQIVEDCPDGQGVTIGTVSLDEYFASPNARPAALDMIKIDVEGFECPLLRGAAKTLKKYRPIVVVETRTAAEFELVSAELSKGNYYPIATFNVTPTIIFLPVERVEELLPNVLSLMHDLQKASVFNQERLNLLSRKNFTLTRDLKEEGAKAREDREQKLALSMTNSILAQAQTELDSMQMLRMEQETSLNNFYQTEMALRARLADAQKLNSQTQSRNDGLRQTEEKLQAALEDVRQIEQQRQSEAGEWQKWTRDTFEKGRAFSKSLALLTSEGSQKQVGTPRSLFFPSSSAEIENELEALFLLDTFQGDSKDLATVSVVGGKLNVADSKGMFLTRLVWPKKLLAGSWPDYLKLIARKMIRDIGPVERIFVSDTSPCLDIVSALFAYHSIPYTLIFTGQKRYLGSEFFMFHNASEIIFQNENAKTEFNSLYIYPLTSENSVQRRICLARDDRGKRPVAGGRRKKRTKRSLLVSYFAGPISSVGVFRANYWYNNFKKVGSKKSALEMVSSVPSTSKDKNYHYVPDYGGKVRSKSISTALSYFPNLPEGGYRFDIFAYYWALELERYFDDRPWLTYDNVIITGNPYLHFGFAQYAKQKWGAKVILDYRDPFSNNPRMVFSPQERKLLQGIEKNYNAMADNVITVNSFCADLVEGREDVITIDNGFNDVELNAAKARELPQQFLNFCYAGTYYRDCGPEIFIDCLNSENMRLHKIGKNAKSFAGGRFAGPAIINYQSLPYIETIEILKGCDVGIVFTGGKPFESTTKIFDYIGVGLDILIVTNGEPYQGGIHNITKDLTGIFWVRNKEDEIREFLASYRFTKKRPPSEREAFSRKEGLRRLKNLL